MKTKIENLLLAGLVFAALDFTTSCEKESMDPASEACVCIIDVADDGTTTFNETNLKSTMVETPVLTDSELVLMLHMKEEEKLARDVNSFFYQKLETPIFSRISLAENRHMNAIITLLKYYDIPDTLVGEPGVFSNPEFQDLYFELTEKGSDSVEAALMIGALIEEMDIVDLKEGLAIVDNENIIRVFEHLLIGSRNHLRAFNRQLVNLGLAYTPVYLTQEEYDQVVNTPTETGHRYRVHYRGNNHRNGQVNGRGEGQGNGDGKRGDNGNGDGSGDGEGNGNGGRGGNGRG
jgi:hypothetical protein